MQRGMRNYSPSPANSTGGLFTTKSGAIDRHKLGLVLVCSLLCLWVVYDTCAHIHRASFASAVKRAQMEMSRPGVVGDAKAVGGVLVAPGSASGKLPESIMFRNLDYQTTSFFSGAGVISNPVLAEHLVSRQAHNVHMATLLPGATRGNHLHERSKEVLVLLHGRFLLRVAMLGNDGRWVSEDHLFEVGVPPSPFSAVASVVSSTPIGVEIQTDVCMAIKNIDDATTAFIAGYFVHGEKQQKEEPTRDVCRQQKVAFLP